RPPPFHRRPRSDTMRSSMLALLLLLIPTAVHAAADCEGKQTLVIEGKSREFCLHRRSEALVSKECLGKGCEALALLERARNSGTPGDAALKGGKNPGS